MLYLSPSLCRLLLPFSEQTIFTCSAVSCRLLIIPAINSTLFTNICRLNGNSFVITRLHSRSIYLSVFEVWRERTLTSTRFGHSISQIGRSLISSNRYSRSIGVAVINVTRSNRRAILSRLLIALYRST